MPAVAVTAALAKLTVALTSVSPVLLTVNTKSVVPVLPSAWLTSSIDRTGAASSLTIVPVPVPFVAETVALVALLRLTVKVSLVS